MKDTDTDFVDTHGTDQMICPWCGCVVDAVDYHGSSDPTGTCNKCGKDFSFDIEYSATYYTKKIDGIETGYMEEIKHD